MLVVVVVVVVVVVMLLYWTHRFFGIHKKGNSRGAEGVKGRGSEGA